MIKRLLLLLFILPTMAMAQDNAGVFPEDAPVFRMSIPFNQKLDRTTPFVSLNPGAISEARNMVRLSPGVTSGWGPRKGMAVHNSTTIGASTIDSLHQYINKDFGTRIFVAQYGNTAIYSASDDPPDTGTTFGTNIYTATGATGIAVSDHINDDWIGVATGASPWGWSGGTAYPDGFVVETNIDSKLTAVTWDTNNILGNGDFEDGEDDPPDDWDNLTATGTTETSSPPDGTYYVKVEGGDGGNDYIGQLNIDSQGSGEIYWLSYLYKITDGDESIVVVGDGTTTEKEIAYTDANWHSATAVVTTTDATDLHAYIGVVDATDIVYYDNVRLSNMGNALNSADSAYLLGYDDGIDRVVNSVTTENVAIIKNTGSYDAMYVGYRRRLTGVYFYLGSTKNAVASDMNVYAWRSNAWVQLTETDGTMTGTETLAQSGAITWTRSASDEPMIMDGVDEQLFWYKFSASANITDGVEVYECRVYSDCEAVSNLSSNVWNSPLSVVVEDEDGDIDATSAATDSDDDTFACGPEFDGMPNGEAIYIGSATKLMGLWFDIRSNYNNQFKNSAPTVYYWNQATGAWATVGTLQDATNDGESSMRVDGIIQWDVTDVGEDKRIIAGDVSVGIPLYYYKILWSLGMNAEIAEIGVMYKPGAFPEYDGVIEYHNRALWYPGQTVKSGVDYSQAGFPQILNGTDSGNTGNIFGDGVVNAITNIASGAIVSTKNPYKLYGLSGTTPATYQASIISTRIGAIAPNTMMFMSGGLKLFSRDTIANGVIFLAPDGFYVTNGNTVVDITSPISDYFDTSSAPYIEPAYMDDSFAWVDYEEKTVHFAVPINLTGSGTQTTLNRELVYSYFADEWYDQHEREYPAACGLSVIGSDNKIMPYIGDYNGKVFRTNTTVLDVAAEIDHYLVTTPISPLMKQKSGYLNYQVDLRGIGVKAKADTQAGSEAKIQAYWDGNTTGVAVGDMSLVRTGYTYATDYLLIDSGAAGTPMRGEEFSFKFDNEAVSSSVMRLLGFTLSYQPVRPTY